MLTDDVPVEVTEIDARPAATPGWTAVAALTMWGLTVFVVDVEIGGIGVALFYCRPR